jgi:hypothetical protein
MSRRALKSISAGISGVVLFGALALAAPPPPQQGKADGSSSDADAPVVISMPDGKRIVYRINTKVRTGPRTSRFSAPWPGIKRMSSGGRSGSGGVTFGPHGSAGSASAGSRTSMASSGGGGGDSSGGGPDMGQAWVPEVPRSDGGSGATLPDAMITALSMTGSDLVVGYTPFTVHVQATDSVLGAGSWQEADFVWSFGDKSDQSLTTIDPRTGETVNLNKEDLEGHGGQHGFNAAYVYEQPGDYIITLKMKNAAGAWDTAKLTVKVTTPHRVVRYVDSVSGSNSNDGASPSSAWRSFTFAISQLTDNMELRFKSGRVFATDMTGEADHVRNVVINSYGAGEKPVIRWIGGGSRSTVLRVGSTASDMTIRDLRFETDTEIDTSSVRAIEIKHGAMNTSVIECEFAGETGGTGFDRWVSTTGGVTGVLVLNCSGGSMRGHAFPFRGHDHVYVGNVAGESIKEHIMRGGFGGMTRINTSWCFFDYMDSKDNSRNAGKGPVRYGSVQFGYLYQCSLLNGSTEFGHDDSDGDYLVLDGCVLSDGQNGYGPLVLKHNAMNIMVRNNVFITDDDYKPAIRTAQTSTFSGDYGVEHVAIVSNTFIAQDRTKHGAMINLTKGTFPVVDVRLANNLYSSVSSNSVPVLQLKSSTLSSFTSENNNYPSRDTDFSYVTIDDAGMTWDEWVGQTYTHNETNRDNVPPDELIASALYAFDSGAHPVAAALGRPVDGVFRDYMGAERDPHEQSWAVGALARVADGE